MALGRWATPSATPSAASISQPIDEGNHKVWDFYVVSVYAYYVIYDYLRLAVRGEYLTL